MYDKQEANLYNNLYGGISDLKTWANSPENQQTIADARTIVHHTAGMTASGDQMLADGAYKTHQILHPDKVKLGFWGTVWVVLQGIHKLEPPIF